MNKKFVTEAIQNDRYLKAIRLIDQFENEVRAELERAGNGIVAENPDLFVNGVEPKWNNGQSSSSIIAYARVDYEMRRRKSMEELSEPLKLNINLRWMDPLEWGHHDIDGALVAASYRVKGCTQEDFDRVKQQTVNENWELQFGEGQFRYSTGAVYVPVETAEELQRAHEVFKEHFSEYGRLYGVDPEEPVG